MIRAVVVKASLDGLSKAFQESVSLKTIEVLRAMVHEGVVIPPGNRTDYQNSTSQRRSQMVGLRALILLCGAVGLEYLENTVLARIRGKDCKSHVGFCQEVGPRFKQFAASGNSRSPQISASFMARWRRTCGWRSPTPLTRHS